MEGVFRHRSVLSFQTTWILNNFLPQQLEEIKTLQEVPRARKSIWFT